VRPDDDLVVVPTHRHLVVPPPGPAVAGGDPCHERGPRAVTERTDEPLARALDGYRAGSPTEVTDLRRARDLLDSVDPWQRAAPLHATASALVVHPPSGRVLLRWHARQRAWLQVGGHADAGEVDPLAIALREAAEETGLGDLVPWPAPVIVHLVIVPVRASAHEAAHEHVDLRYVLRTADPQAARPEHAAAAVRWLTVPEAIAEVTESNLRETLHRVRALRAARP
jgi:8-oxo-dGTP pyrophosphatase MutT (NUDIX family)